MNRLQRFFARWQNWISVLLVLTYVIVALAAPYIAPLDPKDPDSFFVRVGKATESEPQPPTEKAILGMLPFGIDVYRALVWGSRDALQFGLIVTLSTALFGVLYGAVSGMAGNRLGSFMMRIADSFLAFPPIAGLIFLQQLLLTTIAVMGELNFYSPFFPQTSDPQSRPILVSILERINPLMLSLIVFSWMPYARLVHSIVLTLQQTQFVQAARALGGSPSWIIRKHILRNSTGPAIVLGARDVGGVVLLQATLTFVQIGGDSVWGQMLAQGRNWVIGAGGSLFRYWWVFVPPTVAVMLFGIAWNMIGDGLNDVLEPTTQGSLRRAPFWRRWGRKAKTEPTQERDVLPEAQPQPIPPYVEPAFPSSTPLNNVSSVNGADSILRAARAAVSRGNLPQALHAYQHLIERNKLLQDVLPDLAYLVKQYPGDPQVWQTLGDALSRAGNSDHASQSYEQARKLMQ